MLPGACELSQYTKLVHEENAELRNRTRGHGQAPEFALAELPILTPAHEAAARKYLKIDKL